MEKEELERRLGKYNNILRDNILEYLHSLIELNYSVVNSNMCASDREVLSELDIYKYIATYNIYHRAIKILSNYDSVSYKLMTGNSGILSTVNMGDENRVVFSFGQRHGINNIVLYNYGLAGNAQLSHSEVANSVNSDFLADYCLTTSDFSLVEKGEEHKILTLNRPGLAISQIIFK